MQGACNSSRVRVFVCVSDVISQRGVQVFVQLFNSWQDSEDAEHQEADVDAPAADQITAHLGRSLNVWNMGTDEV